MSKLFNGPASNRTILEFKYSDKEWDSISAEVPMSWRGLLKSILENVAIDYAKNSFEHPKAPNRARYTEHRVRVAGLAAQLQNVLKIEQDQFYFYADRGVWTPEKDGSELGEHHDWQAFQRMLELLQDRATDLLDYRDERPVANSNVTRNLLVSEILNRWVVISGSNWSVGKGLRGPAQRFLSAAANPILGRLGNISMTAEAVRGALRIYSETRDGDRYEHRRAAFHSSFGPEWGETLEEFDERFPS